MRGVAILGSTGSIGRQAQKVLQELKSEFRVLAIAAGRNKELALAQARVYGPEVISLLKEEDAYWLKNNLPTGSKIEVLWGIEGLLSVATWPGVDIVLNAVSGAVGLLPTIKAIEAGKDIALANKETLVAAGSLVMQLTRKNNSKIIPVDSEHSAIWQCLQGENKKAVNKIILTASGGPFRAYNREQLEKVNAEQALNHPNWSMGAKITIDSATLMNKGLEVIEARWLFDINYEQIQVVVHPQSIIHSMVEFVDGSVMAQLGIPDMRLPIQYALTYPNRVPGSVPRLNWPIGELSFESPNLESFPCLKLAYEAGKIGGTLPAVLNAANEAAVAEFLSGRLKFMDIPKVLDKVMGEHSVILKPSLEEILAVDRWARERVIV